MDTTADRTLADARRAVSTAYVLGSDSAMVNVAHAKRIQDELDAVTNSHPVQIATISGYPAVAQFLDALNLSARAGRPHTIRIAIDNGTLKVKIGEGAWTAPLDATVHEVQV